MGAVKQLMLKELEDARVELEEILALVEKCVAVEGYIPVDTLQQIADLFSAYAKVWPKEDMKSKYQEVLYGDETESRGLG